MIEIIWYREIKENKWGWEHWYNEMSQYEILFKEWSIKKICTLSNDYWDCPSGRTSATWWDKKIKSVSDFWEIHFKPINKIELDNIDDFINVSNDWWDIRYPSWYACIKDEFINLFEKTNRYKEKRQVYIFTWNSWKWKSYIWRKSSIRVFETDIYDKLPNEITEEIIVLWNKHNFTLKEIKSKINNSDIIEVNFN